MSGQSPVRNRKSQVSTITQGPMQQSIAVPREASPSPSFRERQRAMKAHSMPVVPSVGQVLAVSAQQNQQSSPTTSNSSHQSRRSPPPIARISPTAAKLAANGRDRSPQRFSSPPPLIHAHSQPVVTRPIPRVPPPQFLAQYQNSEEKWQMTPELVADIDRADELQGQLQGTSGVAYAGGAASSHLHLSVTARDPAVERIRASDRSSPKDRTRDKDRDPLNSRESPKTRERSQTVSSVTSSSLAEPQVRGQERPSEFRASPQYHSPMTTPGERTTAYTQYIPDNYPSQQSPTGHVARKPPPANAIDVGSPRDSPTGPTKATSQTPPLHNRPPDRSLPVQEEPEEDVDHEHSEQKQDYFGSRHASPTNSTDVYTDNTRYDPRSQNRHVVRPSSVDEDDLTLNEEAEDHHDQSGEDDSSGFTPRSPSTNLPERPRDGGLSPQHSGQYPASVDNQRTIRAKPRAGSTDQLGIRGFDAALFENSTVQNLRSNQPDNALSGPRQAPQTASASQPPSNGQAQQYRPGQQELVQQQQEYQATSRQQAINHIAEQYLQYGSGSLPAYLPNREDLHSAFEDPTSAYLQAFLQSPKMRPHAPIPPTPHSQTAAPSPSPAISATPSVLDARQVGSPYPYPFTHIRRNTAPSLQNAPSTNFDPNNPDVIREQLALQWQIYALNNGLGGSASESAFSPASTPFPGPAYNPWTFIHQPARPGDSNMSLRSSPSHEPVSLPLPPARGRGIRRKDQSSYLRTQTNTARRRVKPPPRVESTQPRETSPELSSGSGEETAGEESFVHQYTNASDTKWTNGVMNVKEDDEDGDWIDENEDDEEDLLQLEYHPTFIAKTEKRRRRWETRWDVLAQAFQALDRETDATLVLLAAPSHSTKMHFLTSRSIRREPALSNSKAIGQMKSSFSQLAAQRRASRTHRASLLERLSSASSGSPGSSTLGGDSREEDLRLALQSALASLGALGSIYEQREGRWREEMRKISEDRAHVELLLRQALGPALANGHDARLEESEQGDS